MTDSEREWTKVDGIYWWQRSEVGIPDPIVGPCRIASGSVYVIGHAGPRRVPTDSKFLGPITPADAEQLAELRDAAKPALAYLVADPHLTAHGQAIATRLRAALAPKQQEGKVME